MNVQSNNKRGFTLIEVILVLAIAALIFLMVFVALPALQASQRDTARKNDASTVAAAVQSYMSAERKALTDTDDAALLNYVDELNQYTVQNTAAATPDQSGIDVLPAPSDYTATITVPNEHIQVYVGTKCDGTGLQAGVARSASVMIRLEGGTGNNYCVDV